MTKEYLERQFKNYHSVIGGYITPQMFGAKGDGVTDDTEALQRCFNAGSGRTIHFTKGTYLVSQEVYIKSNTHIVGEGNQTVIIPDDNMFSSDGIGMFSTVISGYGALRKNITIENMTFRGSENVGNARSGIVLLWLRNAQNVVVRDCIFQNNNYLALAMSSYSEDYITNHITVENCRFEACDCGTATIGNYHVDDVILRNNVYTGKSTLNDFVNYHSEQVSIYSQPSGGCSYRWLIENCLFEYKQTNVVTIGASEHKNMGDFAGLLAKDITVRNITSRCCSGTVLMNHAQNVVVDGVYLDSTEVETEILPNSTYRVIQIGNYCNDVKVTNVVSDVESVYPINIDGSDTHNVTLENIKIKGQMINGGIPLTGDNIIIKNMVIDSPLMTTRLLLKNLTNSYIECLVAKGSAYGFNFYKNGGTVENNTFVYGTEDVEKVFTIGNNNSEPKRPAIGSLTSKTASTNTFIDKSNFVAKQSKISQLNVFTAPSTWRIVYSDSKDITNNITTPLSINLLEEGHIMRLEFACTTELVGQKFKYNSDGNVVPLDSYEFELNRPSVATVISEFKQIGSKWVETSRIRKYADGRIEDMTYSEDYAPRLNGLSFVTESKLDHSVVADYTPPSALLYTQGMCTDGTHLYVSYIGGDTNNCYLFKSLLSDGSLVKAVADFPLGHCNSMTYNADEGIIYAVALTNDGLLYKIKPNLELADTPTVNIDLSDVLPNYTGIGAIAYCQERQKYVCLLRGARRGYAILDRKFRLNNIIWTEVIDGTYGSCYADKNFIYQLVSGYNKMLIFNWAGELVKNMTVPSTTNKEIEDMVIVGDKVYINWSQQAQNSWVSLYNITSYAPSSLLRK